jgi:hypothetical protein
VKCICCGAGPPSSGYCRGEAGLEEGVGGVAELESIASVNASGHSSRDDQAVDAYTARVPAQPTGTGLMIINLIPEFNCNGAEIRLARQFRPSIAKTRF